MIAAGEDGELGQAEPSGVKHRTVASSGLLVHIVYLEMRYVKV